MRVCYLMALVLATACTFDRSGLPASLDTVEGTDALVDLPSNPDVSHDDDSAPDDGEPDDSEPSDTSDALPPDTLSPDTYPHLPWADFSNQTIQTRDMVITPGNHFAYNTDYGNSWRITLPNGGFSGTFTMAAAGQYTLDVEHLSSQMGSCQGGGYSPVTIKVNNITIAKNWCPAAENGGSHNWVTDSWTISTTAGQNTLEWVGGVSCSHYWIKWIEIR